MSAFQQFGKPQAIVAMLLIALPGSVQVVMARPIEFFVERSGEGQLTVDHSIEDIQITLSSTTSHIPEYPIKPRKDISSSTPTHMEATSFHDAIEAFSQTPQFVPESTTLPQDPAPTSLNILVNTGPMALSIAGVVIMGMNVLTLAAIVVIATFLYKHRARKNAARLSIDTAGLNVQRTGNSHDYNTFELKDRPPSSYLHVIQEDLGRPLGGPERSPSPATPSSFKFPLRGSAQAPPESNIHPIPKRKLSLTSLTNFANTV